MNKPRIGVSSCLLGNNVRYDGNNTYLSILSEIDSAAFELIPFCPEMEMGLGVPRETIQLVQVAGQVQLMPSSRKTSLNHSARETFDRLELARLNGFILQSRSPSCGYGTTKLYSRNSAGEEKLLSQSSNGLFADYLIEHFQQLPLLDSSLVDQTSLQEFLKSVLSHYNKK